MILLLPTKKGSYHISIAKQFFHNLVQNIVFFPCFFIFLSCQQVQDLSDALPFVESDFSRHSDGCIFPSLQGQFCNLYSETFIHILCLVCWSAEYFKNNITSNSLLSYPPREENLQCPFFVWKGKEIVSHSCHLGLHVALKV